MKRAKRKVFFAIVVGVLALSIIVSLLYISYSNRSADSGDIYYDKNGCAQSRSGGVHPNYCIEQQ